jgi:uncharacterized protein (DUF1778 family)
MATKKQTQKIKRKGTGLRVLPSELAVIDRAAKKDAAQREISFSRNRFCAEAVMAAARKVLASPQSPAPRT